MSDIREYVTALLQSERLGPQVAHHRILPGCGARFAEPRRPWPRALAGILKERGIERLYSHQAEAADLIRAGRHVVVATPTASGKTLCYNLPVMEEMLRNPDNKALYLFPLKALAQDQLRAFNDLASSLPEAARPQAAIYDGDTSPYRRKKLRQEPPNVLLTNPEMVHLSLLPHHGTWAALFAGLTHVVVDEVHTYRGVLGSHMACLLRRMRRICRYYGSEPCFVFCSATVGNPAELCSLLSGLQVEAVTESGAAQGDRHVVFLNPADGAAQAAILMLQAALARGLRTIVYCQSRKLTELIALWAAERSGSYKGRISAYRSGFLPEERRDIESRMASGELLAVISTSALELGIDIGGLDLCLLVGYPGTVMATLQRGGRVGRKQQDSAVALIAGEDALDQYFMRHPEDFFARPAESAVVNPANEVILDRHLVCAAAELTLRMDEPYVAEPAVSARVERLLAQGRLFLTADGDEVASGRKRPHHELDLRGAGRSLHIEDEKGVEIGAIDEFRAYRETHPGAVYLHRGVSYVVDEMDLETRAVRAHAERVGYYTRPRGNKDTEILEILGRKTVAGTRAFFGRLRVTERVTGYEKRSVRGGRLLTIIPLDFPPLVFETEGLWFEIPDAVRRAAEAGYLHFMGGIHAMEHAAIGIMPLVVMADRNDLGGISTPFHEQVRGPAVFIYDGLPGGAGLSRQAFAQADGLLRVTLRAIGECPCETGCPSCVHSPKCGSGNRPIDKEAARFVLQRILESPAPCAADDIEPCMSETVPTSPAFTPRPAPERYAVFDVETRRSADEVGGWHRAERMGVSVAVVFDSQSGEFFEFTEDRVADMVELLRQSGLVIGFNVRRFDYKVLSGLTDFPVHELPTLDLLEVVTGRLGYRLSLDNLASSTLGQGKSADGLQALRWWKEGRLDLIAAYCRQDVAATRDLFLFGRAHGHVLFENKAGRKVRLPVDW